MVNCGWPVTNPLPHRLTCPSTAGTQCTRRACSWVRYGTNGAYNLERYSALVVILTTDLYVMPTSLCSLRTSDRLGIFLPRVRIVLVQSRSFGCAAFCLCNGLPYQSALLSSLIVLFGFLSSQILRFLLESLRKAACMNGALKLAKCNTMQPIQYNSCSVTGQPSIRPSHATENRWWR